MRTSGLVMFAILALTAPALLAVGCGGEEKDVAPGPTSPAASPTPAVADPTPATAAPTPATAVAPSPTRAGPRAQTLSISMLPANRFNNKELRARTGTEITVRFDNRDTGIPHNWALYRDEDYDDAIAGKNRNICNGPCSAEVTLGPLDPGTYFFRCDVHPAQMTGELIVG